MCCWPVFLCYSTLSFIYVLVLAAGCVLFFVVCFFFFKQKTAYEMRISDWSSDVCSSDLDVLAGGREALVAANRDWGLALSGDEIDYLVDYSREVNRNPTDAELMMFAQVNSEHCRHKIFNAEFTVDGETQPHSLFQMIKMTYAASPQGVLSAYKDNASVIEGHTAMRWFAESDHVWLAHDEPVHNLMKVETHNHPLGI